MKKLIRTLSALSLLLVTLCGCRGEQTEDIYIVFTNDVASKMSGEIGYAGVKGFRDHYLSEHPYVALVDAGDFLDGSISHQSNGKYIIQVMNAVGYDVVTLGNQEFSNGLDALADNIRESNFTYLSCNLKYLGSGIDPLNEVKPYVIKQYGNTKVAFVGVTTPETLKPGKPAYNALVKDGELLYDFYGGNDGQELYDQVQKTVDQARRRADYVIVIAHLGLNSVTKGFSSYELIANTTGIDAMLDGHSHTQNAGEAVLNKNGDVVVLASTGEKLDTIGLMILNKDHTFTTAIYPHVYYKDASIQEMVDQIYSELGQ